MPQSPSRMKLLTSFIRSAFYTLAPFMCLVPTAAGADLDARIEAHRKQGLPLTLDELEKWHAYPEGANAADIYMKAFEQWVTPPNGKTKISFFITIRFPARAELLPAATVQAIKKCVETNQPALKLLRDASKIAACRFPADFREGYGMTTQHSTHLKEAAKLLHLQILHLMEQRQFDRAIEAWATAFAAVDSLTTEPTLDSQVVRISVNRMASLTLENILNRRVLSDSELQRLSALLMRPERTVKMTRALVGELCMELSYFELSDSGKAEWQISKPEAEDILPYKAARISGAEERDRQYVTEIILDAIDASKQPFPASLIAGDEARRRLWDIRLKNRPPSTETAVAHASSLTYLPFDLGAENAAAIRIMRIVLAVERLRLKTDGELPDSLSELVPHYLDAIPSDPFDGAPLRYKRLPKGYSVYSIGRNRKDDDGSEAVSSDMDIGRYDVTFIVER